MPASPTELIRYGPASNVIAFPEDALVTWQEAGSPDQTSFGMTVTDLNQIVWLGHPEGPCWRLPN